jgi:hypothetical protein
MTTDTTIGTGATVLGALDLPVPAMPFTLGTVRTWQGRDGQGCQVKVMQGRTLLGTLDDEGNGGGTWFRPQQPGTRQMWQDYVRAFDGRTYDVWSAPDGGPLTLGSSNDGRGSEEDVATLLSLDAMLAKDLNRASRTRTLFLLDDDRPADGPQALSGGPDSPAARQWLQRQHGGRRIRIWDRTARRWQQA